MEISKRNTLSDIVRQDFRASRVFEKYNLDFCCNGNRMIDDACREKGLDTDKVMNELKTEMLSAPDTEINFDALDLDELIKHIVDNHHAYLKRIFPVLNTFSEKVLKAHGGNHPELKRVSELFAAIESDLSSHLVKEENVLFPFIVKMAVTRRNNGQLTGVPFGSVRNPINQMEAEHNNAGNALHELRSVTNDFAVPDDACNTFRSFYEELNNFENDLHVHIHLENNILHPKAIALEEELLY